MRKSEMTATKKTEFLILTDDSLYITLLQEQNEESVRKSSTAATAFRIDRVDKNLYPL